MKINKKIIVSALAVAMGAGVVGSVSGTVAWYQYSTRAVASFIGVSSGKSQNLQIAVAAECPAQTAETWKSTIKSTDIETYLATTEYKNKKFKPITWSNSAKTDVLDEEDFVGRPREYVPARADWGSVFKEDYVSFPLWVRTIEKDKDGIHEVANSIGISDLQIVDKAVEGKQDITNAVRVHIKDTKTGGTAATFAASEESIDTFGGLDLDSELGNEQWNPATETHYENEEDLFEEVIYGTADSTLKTYDLSNSTTMDAFFVEEVEDDETGNMDITGGVEFANTVAATTGHLKLMVTVWIEGWAELATQPGSVTNKSIWDEASYDGSEFYVNLELMSGYNFQ